MATEYDISVSRRQWQIGLFAFALTAIGGVALAIALGLGAANTPHGSKLVYNATNADDFAEWRDFGESKSSTLSIELTPSFTVEMEARSLGDATSGWGLWASNNRGDYTTNPLMIDNSGYVVTGVDDDSFAHFEFPHIHRGDFNRMVLHFDVRGLATFRINDEFFRSALLSAGQVYTVGLDLYREPKIEWKAIKIYTG